MTEARFIHENAERWKELERVLERRGRVEPDQLADLYVRVTDDLSFARTFYPESKAVAYLNGLAARLHQRLYGNRREARSRLVTFWTREVPEVLHQERRALAWSLIVFAAALFVGGLSAASDDSFVRLILGDEYVDMTLYNIERGDPMAVYKQVHAFDMFLGITLNNVLVSFRVFALGLLAGLGTIVALLYNGVMIGSFFYFLGDQGVIGPAMRTVWIHGTLEIAALVIAGGAGLVLGRGMLFPGSYPRLHAFTRGARRGLKIIMGMVPIFVVAAFLEGFVTRHDDMPLALALAIIGGSAAFVYWYVILHPSRVARSSPTGQSTNDA